jgi:hypothetical protein
VPAEAVPSPPAGYAEERYEERPPRPVRREYPEEPYEARRARAGSAVVPPAICLLVTGILGFLGAALQFAMTALNPESLENAQRMLAQLGLPQQQAPPLSTLLVIQGLFVGLGLLVTVGAIQMLRRRTYGLAMASSILAMLNITNCCCLLGIPFGIWALVVLARPEVKAAFE